MISNESSEKICFVQSPTIVPAREMDGHNDHRDVTTFNSETYLSKQLWAQSIQQI